MKKVISTILALSMILAMIFSLVSCNGADSNEFRVGLECGYAPFNWTQTTDSNGAVAISGGGGYAGGYDVEIAKKIADGLGKKLVIVKTKWEGLPPAVESKTIDAIIAGMSPKAERKLTLDFSEAYYRSYLVMVVKKGSKFASYTDIQQFTGATITGQKGTVHYGVIPQIIGVKKATEMESFPAMRTALESGIIDGYVSEKPEAVSASAANPNFTFVEFEKGKGFVASDEEVTIAVGFKKGQPDLIKKVNEILAGISEQDRLDMMETAIKNQPAS